MLSSFYAVHEHRNVIRMLGLGGPLAVEPLLHCGERLYLGLSKSIEREVI